jgi:hypothetical protein
MPFLGNEPSNTFVSIAKQTITGNGGTSYALSYAVTSANDIDVFYNNVRQEPGVAYTATGTTITFTETIASTDSVYVLFNNQAIGTISPPTGSVGPSAIVDAAVDNTKLASTLDLSTKTITLPSASVTFAQLSTPGTSTNPFRSVAHAQMFGVARGLYYFTNGTNTQQLYYDHADGGWILVASSNASDTTIPGGTSRNNSSYYVNRNGTLGALGTASPNSDYLIGAWLDTFKFGRIKGLGWGRGSTNGTYTWPSNLGTYIQYEWQCDSYTQVTHRNVVPVQLVSDGTGTNSSANYFVMDSVRMDASLNANSNQSTIGWAGVSSSNGDSSDGCLLGHGNSEGSYEGWYNAASTPVDCQGWTTWVR